MTKKDKRPMFDLTRHDELSMTAKRLSTIHTFLNAGTYPGSTCKEMMESLGFIEQLHAGVMKDLQPLIDAKAELEPKAAASEELPDVPA